MTSVHGTSSIMSSAYPNVPTLCFLLKNPGLNVTTYQINHLNTQ